MRNETIHVLLIHSDEKHDSYKSYGASSSSSEKLESIELLGLGRERGISAPGTMLPKPVETSLMWEELILAGP